MPRSTLKRNPRAKLQPGLQKSQRSRRKRAERPQRAGGEGD